MNNIRRKRLNKLNEQLSEILIDLDELRSEEEEYLYNIPENLQCSDRYEKSENAFDNLEEAYSNLEEVINCIECSCE